MSTDPGPQNSFWVDFQNFIWIVIRTNIRSQLHYLLSQASVYFAPMVCVVPAVWDICGVLSRLLCGWRLVDHLPLLCRAASCVYGARAAVQRWDSCSCPLLTGRILHAELNGTFTFVHMERYTASAYDGELRIFL